MRAYGSGGAGAARCRSRTDPRSSDDLESAGNLHNGGIERPSPRTGRSRARLGRARLAALLAVVAVIVVAAVALAPTREEEAGRPRLALPSEIVGPDPLAFEEGRTPAYERAAAFGLSHVLFAKSPGGVVASARRTSAFRPLIDDVVAGSEIDAELLEAIVLLESAGRPDVIAGDDPANAAGLTQILAGTATGFLGMHVDLAASRRLTRRLVSARRRGDAAAVERLRERRRRVDARFDPAQALAGTVRYLTQARRWLGRDDLAMVSYHMGIGNLTSVLRSYSRRPSDPIEAVVEQEDLDYARVYFDSSPARHRKAWERLASFGDDSQTYYWRVLAAREIMGLFREAPAALERLAALHGRGPSGEAVLQPPDGTSRFAEPEDLEVALVRGVLRPLPGDPAGLPFRIGAAIDRTASRTGADAALYRALRPRAIQLLRYLAAQVHDLSGDETPLIVARAADDESSGPPLAPAGREPRKHRSLHATGYAFDIRRRYGSGRQAAAFQWTLERLEALGLIAWWRSKSVIHVAVSPLAEVRAAAGGRS